MNDSIPSHGEVERANWCAQFLAPIRYCLRPSLSGPAAVNNSTSAWLCNLLLAIVFVFVLVVVFDAWDHTVHIPATQGIPTIQTRTWIEAFRMQWGANAIEELGLLFIGIAAIVIALILVGSWVFMIDMYRSGPIAPAALRVLRLISASGWPAIILAIVFGGLFVLAEHSDRRDRVHGISTSSFYSDVVTIYAFPICIWLTVSWIGRATRAASKGNDATQTPLCESCGYDLTHMPGSGTCTECGTAIADSVGESAKRRGVVWEATPRPPFSLAILRSVIVRPSTFYRSLQLRTGHDAALRFARLNFVLMGVLASIWIVALVLSSVGRRSEDGVKMALLAGAGLLIGVPLVGMLLQRVIFAIVATGWIVRGSLRDAQWALKGLYYETAFLWVFSLWTALCFTCLVNLYPQIRALEEWVFGRRIYIFGMPPDAIFFLGGEAILCLIWIWRFRQFYLAIRWNNA